MVVGLLLLVLKNLFTFHSKSKLLHMFTFAAAAAAVAEMNGAGDDSSCLGTVSPRRIKPLSLAALAKKESQ